MTVRVAVDFGTSSTCVVVSINGRDPQVVVIDGQPLMSSAVYVAADGTLFVGQEAERQAAVDPSRYEPNPKRRIDEGELLLGDAVLRVTDVVHAVLARAVTEARRIAGQAEVDLLVLTHPADWGAIRTRLLRQAAGRLAREVALVPEPVAAAVYHAATFAPSAAPDGRTVEYSGSPGDVLAVLDLGGGTVDVSVVRRSPEAARAVGGPPRRGGFQVLATRGDPSFGGADIDQALLEHVGSLVSDTDPQAWRQLVEGRELAERRRRRVVRQDVRGAKETLSRHAYTDVPLPPPFADAHVTREDLERLIAAPLGRVIELTSAAIADAGLRPKQLTAIFLVGGSSRIPMISRLAHERTGVVPTSLDQPETVVARGALRAVQLDPDRTGALPGTPIAGRRPEHRTEVVLPSDQPDPDHRPRRGAPSPGRGFPADPFAAPGSFPAQPLPRNSQGSPFGTGSPAGAGGQSGPGNPFGAGSHAGAGAPDAFGVAPPGGAPGAGSPSGPGGARGGGPSGSGGARGGGLSGSGGGRGVGPSPRPGAPGSLHGAVPASGPGALGGASGAGPSSGPGAPGAFGASPSYRAGGSGTAHGDGGGSDGSSGKDASAPGKWRRKPLVAIAVVAVAAVAAAGVVFLVTRPDDQASSGKTFQQYDFSLEAPQDWLQTGDTVAERQVVLHPQEAPEGGDLVAAEEVVMNYDATADPRRLQDDLQTMAGQSASYSAFQPKLAYGGRTVISYRQTKDDGLQVDWFVVAKGRIRVHVGCQYDRPALRQRVGVACEQIVRTLKITS
ncbi:type VII secretion-associated protein [Amycolatopsis jiangsuensis]|uniref:Type VII secretion-associated protein (TIGR03931 family) n=1 Tax=Amycolatopsis jiangsuensis TaxID=1181879 RepID=A0A840IZ48_9PSEU|nr:type VII secretion-associated protein [Amycolatopsis jiangsuensis]MBB4686428.1 type VII secretion-associated protein (TIGR03931 family) [Amycolatopsis jiangsuensis]